MMNSPQINLTSFRKTFNIPSDFIRSTCKILNIEIEKIDNEQYISLNNDLLNTENDTILLYAFLESKETGKIEKTKQKNFNDDAFDKCSDYAFANEYATYNLLEPSGKMHTKVFYRDGKVAIK